MWGPPRTSQAIRNNFGELYFWSHCTIFGPQKGPRRRSRVGRTYYARTAPLAYDVPYSSVRPVHLSRTARTAGLVPLLTFSSVCTSRIILEFLHAWLGNARSLHTKFYTIGPIDTCSRKCSRLMKQKDVKENRKILEMVRTLLLKKKLIYIFQTRFFVVDPQ